MDIVPSTQEQLRRGIAAAPIFTAETSPPISPNHNQESPSNAEIEIEDNYESGASSSSVSASPFATKIASHKTPSSMGSTSSCSEMEDSSSPDLLTGRGVGTMTNGASASTAAIAPSSLAGSSPRSYNSQRANTATVESLAMSEVEPGSLDEMPGILPRLRPRVSAVSYKLDYSSASSGGSSVSPTRHRSKRNKRRRIESSSAAMSSRPSKPGPSSRYPSSPPARREEDKQKGGGARREQKEKEENNKQEKGKESAARVAAPCLPQRTGREERLSLRALRSRTSPLLPEASSTPPPPSPTTRTSARPSALEVLDLSVSSPREIIDIDDDALVALPPPQQRRSAGSRVGSGQEKPGRGGGSSGGGCSSGCGGGASGRRHMAEIVEAEGITAPPRRAMSRRSAAVRLSAFPAGSISFPSSSSSSSSSSFSSSSRAGSRGAVLVAAGEGGSENESARLWRSLRNGAGAAAPSTAAAAAVADDVEGNDGDDEAAFVTAAAARREGGGSFAARRRQASSDGERFAARLQRRESSRQEQRDAAMARRLQSQEGGAIAGWSVEEGVLGSVDEADGWLGLEEGREHDDLVDSWKEIILGPTRGGSRFGGRCGDAVSTGGGSAGGGPSSSSWGLRAGVRRGAAAGGGGTGVAGAATAAAEDVTSDVPDEVGGAYAAAGAAARARGGSSSSSYSARADRLGFRGRGGGSAGRGAYSHIGGREAAPVSEGVGGRQSSVEAARRRRQQSSSNSRRSSSDTTRSEWARMMNHIAGVGREQLEHLFGGLVAGGGGGEGRGSRGGRGGAGAGGGGAASHASALAMMGRDLTPADYQRLSALDERNGSKGKGLSLSELSMLPQQTGNGTGPTDQCCICMEDMTSRQNITRLPACLHTFHSKCISRWLESQATCPIDKTTVRVS